MARTKGSKSKDKVEDVEVVEEVHSEDSELLGDSVDTEVGKKFVGFHPITKEEVYI